ncbi:MAG: hypothetical protein BGO59_19580 [Spirosoma sp. 48-14]|nr:MAG: hypothetical protein BGO59_19580 [Spirosoma sp. 48-14]
MRIAPADTTKMQLPALVQWKPGAAYTRSTRLWQGCPSIEKTGKRLWSAWFSGGPKEPAKGNYGIIAYSDDDGKTWEDPAVVITHPDTAVRVMDTQLWKDPHGKLWIFWTQNVGTDSFDGLWGTWAIRLDQPITTQPTWTAPRRLCDGLMRNKPIVLTTGEWLLPAYNWTNKQSGVYVSTDQGNQWQLRGGPYNESAYFYEHMLVELNDGRVWLLQRNIKESHSSDRGKSWNPLTQVSTLTSAFSRLYIGRLKSGHLLLAYNDDPDRKSRKNLTVRLSLDDGRSWPHALLIDERPDVSYPDVVQADDGLVYLAYDRSRTGEKEILLATFTEADIQAGSFSSKRSRQKSLISKVP